MANSSGSPVATTNASATRYLRNTWYMAMWSQDLKARELFHRMILDEPLLFFRKEDGGAAAMIDRCPHRFAPLHMGSMLPDGRIRCGYHGLEFDSAGVCVRNPNGNGKIPAAAVVKTYPLAEKHGMVWIWMGDEAPDKSAIPDFSAFDRAPALHIAARDYLLLDSNYELITNNLLDLSHVSYLHEGVLGNAQMASADPKVEQKGETVTVSRDSANVPITGLHNLLLPRNGQHVDTWNSMRWSPPACMLNESGAGAVGAPRSEGTGMSGAHLLTPETGASTHYHFCAVRWNVRTQGDDVNAEIRSKLSEVRRFAFEHEDAPMIHAQQVEIAHEQKMGRTLRPALLSIDAGPARCGRILRELIEREQGREQTQAQERLSPQPS